MPCQITRDARLRLAPKARIQWDRLSQQPLLLYPERGLLLNETAAEILHLCDGTYTVAGMVERMQQTHGHNLEQNRDVLMRDILVFLTALADRGLLVRI